jgi:phage terminase large subunit-like protein
LPRGDSSGRSDLATFARFCRNLTVDEGGPLKLEAFQRKLLADYFGGARETLVILPKKNGKTTLLAALALFHLASTRGQDAECVIGASSRDQAGILYEQAADFVRRSPGLQERLVTKGGYRQIRSRHDAGRIRVLAADVDTADGVIPTLALVDELHRHKSADLYGIFRDGLGPRRGQMITISTAGDHELTPLGQMRAAARRLPQVESNGHYTHARSENGAYAMHEWALTEEADLDDMRVVKKVNPASWQTIEELRERHDSPSMLPWHWARFACGIWIGAEAWWISAADWQAAEVEDLIEPGERITLGFDGSRSGDATALVASRLSDGLLQPLAIWENPTPGREWDVPAGEVDAALALAMEEYRVVRGYFDPPLWQSEIDGWAREYGEPAVLRYPTNRSRMMAAVERFRTDLLAGNLPHAGAAALSRHVLNAQVREVRGGYWLAKPGPGSPDHIDAAVAAVLAYEARCDSVTTESDRQEFAFL